MIERLYTIWRLDCPCGNVTDFGEDHPGDDAACDACGLKANEDDE